MKFLRHIPGPLCVSLALSILTSACNPDDYYQLKEFLKGNDEFCSQAKDLNSCQSLVDVCQPAYKYSENENEAPVFDMCISNPDSYDENPGSNDGTDGSGSNPAPAPTLQDALNANCQIADKYLVIKVQEETKNGKSKGKSVSSHKVKVCHYSNSGSHSIVIACPALKAHTKHHQSADYLGACK
jgi:hypothetical protein